MYPNPRRRFCTSSLDVLLSSGGMIFLISFSSMWMTNSSTDSYPAASEHCFTFSSSSPSIFILCEPNIHPPGRRTVPAGLYSLDWLTRHLRAGLSHAAASRLTILMDENTSPRPLSVWAKDRLAHHLFGLCDSELRQNCRGDVDQRRALRINLAIAQEHSRHFCVIHA